MRQRQTSTLPLLFLFALVISSFYWAYKSTTGINNNTNLSLSEKSREKNNIAIRLVLFLI